MPVALGGEGASDGEWGADTGSVLADENMPPTKLAPLKSERLAADECPSPLPLATPPPPLPLTPPQSTSAR